MTRAWCLAPWAQTVSACQGVGLRWGDGLALSGFSVLEYMLQGQSSKS